MERGVVSARFGVPIDWPLNCGFLRVDTLLSSSYPLSMDDPASSVHAGHQRGHANTYVLCLGRRQYREEMVV